MKIKPLSLARFNAFVVLSRSPTVEYFAEEIEWYADESERVIGILLLIKLIMILVMLF